jgi:hypothetical protein
MLRVAPVLLVLALLAPSPAEAAWRWPLRGEVRRPFAVQAAAPYVAGQHRGIDVAAPPGSVVRATCGGRVRFAGRVGRSGGVVSVRCGLLVATYLELGTVRVARGRRVPAGAPIGTVGAEAHLHLGARRVGGDYVDPLSLLRGPAASPPSLGPAPAPERRVPEGAPPPVAAPVPAAEPAGVPGVAWAGLALVAAGLPIGGVVRHRSRQRTSWTSTSPASRPTSSAR